MKIRSGTLADRILRYLEANGHHEMGDRITGYKLYAAVVAKGQATFQKVLADLRLWGHVSYVEPDGWKITAKGREAIGRD